MAIHTFDPAASAIEFTGSAIEFTGFPMEFIASAMEFTGSEIRRPSAALPHHFNDPPGLGLPVPHPPWSSSTQFRPDRRVRLLDHRD
jgi:hypothetical protein